MYTYDNILYNFSDSSLTHCIEMFRINNFPTNKITDNDYKLNDAMFYIFNGRELMTNFLNALLFELEGQQEMSENSIKKYARNFIDNYFKKGVYLPILFSVKNLLKHKGSDKTTIEKYDIGVTITSTHVFKYCFDEDDDIIRIENFIPKINSNENITNDILINEKGLNFKETEIYENLLNWFKDSFYILLENYLHLCIEPDKTIIDFVYNEIQKRYGKDICDRENFIREILEQENVRDFFNDYNYYITLSGGNIEKLQKLKYEVIFDLYKIKEVEFEKDKIILGLNNSERIITITDLDKPVLRVFQELGL